MNYVVLFLLFFCVGFIFTSGCSRPECEGVNGKEVDADRQTAFRVRADFTAGVNSDEGWAGALNENVTVNTDQPFRIRFEIERAAGPDEVRRYRLQYRRNNGAWTNVEVADFPKPDEISPRVSIVSTKAFENGDETADLLAGSNLPYISGAGVNFDTITLSWSGENAHSEWEWPLVIRRFADGPVTNYEGDTFEFRMADAGGCPISSDINPVITVSVPPGHLGGTFVETPGRIGAWEASNGDLYFIMEPTETDNVLMVVKSSDRGVTWYEVDGANRPARGDLEGFATELKGNTIHMLHQISRSVWYHSFRTADHPTDPDTWDVRDEIVVRPGEPPVQVASIAVRSDGSIVGVYGGPEKVHFKVRSAEGRWGNETLIDANVPQRLSGPQVVLGENDVVHLAYTGDDGSAWYHRIQPDGSLTSRQQIATGLGTTEDDVGSILPLVFIPETNTVVVIYRLATGRLWERRIIDYGSPGEPVQVSDRNVVQNAVDSDQTGADAIADGTNVHVLFIEEGSGSIFHTFRNEGGDWQPSELVVNDVQAQWIRGSLLTRSNREGVYGFVYDAGSNGGTGMNKFGVVPIDSRSQ